MQKLFTFILSLFVGTSCFSQLSVKPSAANSPSYIYVKEKLFYVAGPINLQKNTGNPEAEASIYLREEAQLIQENSDPGQNTGDGMLSIFQEGTSNAYDYNYWSSPVGNDHPGNGYFGLDLIYAPETETQSSRAGNMNALDGSANPLLISRRWIYTFSGTSYSDWHHVSNNTEIPAGRGFTMKGVNGTDLTVVNGRPNNPGNSQRYDFRGKPNTGTITIPTGPGKNILIGNPYPSALDLSLFLIENSGTGSLSSACYGTIPRKNAITGIAYFWDSKEDGDSHYLREYVGGYGAFSPVDPCTTGVYAPPVFTTYGENLVESNIPTPHHYDRRYAPVAQGFMVEGASNSPLEFRNSQRVFRKEGEHSDFKMPGETKRTPNENRKELTILPKITVKVTVNDHYVRELALAFWPSATSGTDVGMDAKPYNVEATDMGFLHNDENYVIDIRPFSENDELPLFLKVEEERSSIKIEIPEAENLITENIFLLDSESGNYYSVTEKSFQMDLDQGIYHGRFRLTFRDQNIESPKIIEKEEELRIFQNNPDRELQIFSPSLIPVSSVRLYDLAGKLVFYRNNSEEVDFLAFTTGHLRNSIYLVKVLSSDGTITTEKISVQNPD